MSSVLERIRFSTFENIPANRTNFGNRSLANHMPLKTKAFLKYGLRLILLSFIVVGVVYRFAWQDWHKGTNLHPDEYGLTNTLTQLSIPDSISEYFNTRISPLSPYNKYDLYGELFANGPDNRMRWGQWPITIIRLVSEISGRTGYDEIRMTGRLLSAVVDSISLLLLFIIAKMIFDTDVALLAVSLGSLAVMQIQQSHFMTVDNFGVLFSMLVILSATMISQGYFISRSKILSQVSSAAKPRYRITATGVLSFLLAGVTFGMAIASRINLLPLGGIIVAAAFIGVADLRVRNRRDLLQIFIGSFVLLSTFLFIAVVTFRLTQPMSFRASTGDTHLLTLRFNQDWVDSMNVAQSESRGIGGGPPAEQWANRTPIVFPLINMVLWGMGLPLGVAAWIGIVWALRNAIKGAISWRNHLVPLLWGLGYFLFMSTRWVKSIRYFLPVYPIFCLYAAWGLFEIRRSLMNRLVRPTADYEKSSRVEIKVILANLAQALAAGLVLMGTFIWATAFVDAVYRQGHTRIEASQWIYDNIPAGSTISNENWDEGLPLSINNSRPHDYDYDLITMEVRWYDNEDKLNMFLENLAKTDYIVLPSQRGIWSVSRLPLTYPMTMEYYRALFDGRLGFDLVAVFHHPLQVGQLYISDIAGKVSWGEKPDLPIFNYGIFAAEEAFSVYDHPPIWIFAKRSDFDVEAARSVLDSIDLSTVIIQHPKDVPSSLY
jgi:hypothetical protein